MTVRVGVWEPACLKVGYFEGIKTFLTEMRDDGDSVNFVLLDDDLPSISFIKHISEKFPEDACTFSLLTGYYKTEAAFLKLAREVGEQFDCYPTFNETVAKIDGSLCPPSFQYFKKKASLLDYDAIDTLPSLVKGGHQVTELCLCDIVISSSYHQYFSARTCLRVISGEESI